MGREQRVIDLVIIDHAITLVFPHVGYPVSYDPGRMGHAVQRQGKVGTRCTCTSLHLRPRDVLS